MKKMAFLILAGCSFTADATITNAWSSVPSLPAGIHTNVIQVSAVMRDISTKILMPRLTFVEKGGGVFQCWLAHYKAAISADNKSVYYLPPNCWLEITTATSNGPAGLGTLTFLQSWRILKETDADPTKATPPTPAPQGVKP